MNEADLSQRLSQINTRWSEVLQARGGPEQACHEAQARLLKRYGGAVYRYLLGAVRDPDVADDLAQELALRFLRGDFRNASPERGRFRNFLKTAVLNLVSDHRRRVRARPQAPEGAPEPADLTSPSADLDREFLARWREELLARAWEALAGHQEESGQPLSAVLRLRAEHPDLSTTELAEQISARLGRPVTGNYARQLLYRARKAFADFLLDDVAQSLDRPTADGVLEELADLGLSDYCRPALERRGPPA